jgi:hypothetical protein
MADPALFIRWSADDDHEKFTCCSRQLAKEHGVETIVVGDECKGLLAHVPYSWFYRRATSLNFAKSLIRKSSTNDETGSPKPRFGPFS